MKTKRFWAILLTAALTAFVSCGGPLDEEVADDGKKGNTPVGDGEAITIYKNGISFVDVDVAPGGLTASPGQADWDACIQVWNDTNDGLGVTFASTTESRPGSGSTKSIELDTGAGSVMINDVDTPYTASWRGIAFWFQKKQPGAAGYPGISSTNISGVKFWAYSSVATVLSSFVGHDASTPAAEAEALSLPANTWTELSYSIDTPNISINHFTLSTGTDAGKIYVDDIRLIGK